jgi:hypothetical protein
MGRCSAILLAAALMAAAWIGCGDDPSPSSLAVDAGSTDGAYVARCNPWLAQPAGCAGADLCVVIGVAGGSVSADAGVCALVACVGPGDPGCAAYGAACRGGICLR